MTFINEYTTYCALCGGPIEDPDLDRSWLSQAVLLHSSNEFPNTEIREFAARNKGGPYFELLKNAEPITAFDKSSSIVPSPRPLYIPCHEKCVSLAKRVMASHEAASHRSVDESMRHMWLVLNSLFEKASKDKFGPICNIYNAQAYGGIWRFQELVWQPGNDPELRAESMLFEADPEDIPDLTELCLAQLQTISVAELDSAFMEPSELPQPTNLSLECTAQSSPDVWRESLVRDHFPWLWDIEPDAVARKEASKPPGQEWNWELLVRQLAQVTLHEPRAVLGDLPIGLRNRRRIWRLVEDILSEQVL